jgi:DNA-binding NtrC family response regulator
MKRRERPQPSGAQLLSSATRRRNGSAPAGQLLQVHPMPRARHEVLAIAVHLLRRFAVAQGKPAPELSEDAARFLAGRRWGIDDLAARVAAAVANNRGSLITAADLCAARARRPA